MFISTHNQDTTEILDLEVVVRSNRAKVKSETCNHQEYTYRFRYESVNPHESANSVEYTFIICSRNYQGHRTINTYIVNDWNSCNP